MLWYLKWREGKMTEKSNLGNVLIISPMTENQDIDEETVKTESYERSSHSYEKRFLSLIKTYDVTSSNQTSRRREWKPVRQDSFKPFYDCSSKAIIYKFCLRPPEIKKQKITNLPLNIESAPTLLTRKLLNLEERGKRNVQRIERQKKPSLEEEWCTCSNIRNPCCPGIRKEAWLNPIGKDIFAKHIWKRVSKSIVSGELEDCNACYKKSEDAVHIFFFENKREMVIRWLECYFDGKVTLSAV